MAHERLRRLDAGPAGPDRDLRHGMPLGLRAGRQVFLRGLTACAPGGAFLGLGDAVAQAEQAMRNAEALLEEAGARMADICKITTYVTDRAYGAPVQAVIDRHLGATAAVGTGLIVNGLARPEMLVEIDVDAVIPEPGA